MDAMEDVSCDSVQFFTYENEIATDNILACLEACTPVPCDIQVLQVPCSTDDDDDIWEQIIKLTTKDTQKLDDLNYVSYSAELLQIPRTFILDKSWSESSVGEFINAITVHCTPGIPIYIILKEFTKRIFSAMVESGIFPSLTFFPVKRLTDTTSCSVPDIKDDQFSNFTIKHLYSLFTEYCSPSQRLDFDNFKRFIHSYAHPLSEMLPTPLAPSLESPKMVRGIFDYFLESSDIPNELTFSHFVKTLAKLTPKDIDKLGEALPNEEDEDDEPFVDEEDEERLDNEYLKLIVYMLKKGKELKISEQDVIDGLEEMMEISKKYEDEDEDDEDDDEEKVHRKIRKIATTCFPTNKKELGLEEILNLPKKLRKRWFGIDQYLMCLWKVITNHCATA